MQRDDDGPGYEQQDLLDQELGWIKRELAMAAALAAKTGGHPEKAPDIERALLQAAGLEEFQLAA